MRSQVVRLGLILGAGALPSSAAEVTRGPYLQSGTPTSLVVRWRTDVNTDSRVHYGTRSNLLDRVAVDPTQTPEHIVTLSGLAPNTTYYYAIAGDTNILAAGPDYFFITAPTTAKPTRLWVLGDAGTRNFNQRAVRDAYYAYTAERHTDLWLMLGDNAYSTGRDSEYQAAVFDTYPHMLRKSVLWPALGNHDAAFDPDPPPDLPFFEIFTLPTVGQAGGVPSGTEKYYSFNYGNIHLICLDSMASDRSSTGPMCAWLRADLADNVSEWTFAYWHHPPYTKGSHNSDAEHELIEMRENVLPVLEAFGVDLVMCGHSHSYERSYLLHGHYDFSDTLIPEMILDPGSGRESESGPYRKGGEDNRGAVYVVAGSSGQTSGGSLDHPAMFISLNQLGSLVLDVNGPRLDATFLRSTGAIADSFTILKGGAAVALRITSFTVDAGIMTFRWSSMAGHTYAIQRAKSLFSSEWETVSPPITATGSNTGWSGLLELDPPLFYRVTRLGN